MGEGTNTEKNKLSYEELENVANNLLARLQQAELSNAFKRVDYLFKVIENSNMFPVEFQEMCVKDIMSFMTIPEEKTEE